MGVLSSDRNKVRAKELFEFTQGIAVDSRIATQEVAVQKAWAAGLGKIGVLTADEVRMAGEALDAALALMAEGKFHWRVEDEDVHMNLERFVTEKHGALGKKMHFGRSRNDLIATTLRLFVRDTATETAARLAELVAALCEQAEKTADIVVPGFTHLQHGQPIRMGHVLAAHGWAFRRDLERVRLAATHAMFSMPLGAAALAGTTLSIDLQEIAATLGFQVPSLNSYDSVGDRDFILEALDAFASVAVHLSRLSEDCIIWSSTPVALMKLPPAWSTGSSIMPNKRNPDVPELIRAKSAHIMAAASNAHTLMKAVPTSYGSDLHELKGVYLRSFDELLACFSVLPEFVRGMEIQRGRAAQLAKKGHILATEIADALAGAGLPFREAYAQVAALVELAEAKGLQIEELPESAWKPVAPKLDPGFMAALSPESAVERRTNAGGTAKGMVHAGIRTLRASLGHRPN